MTYSPTTWTTGDTITASALNKIEQGIADAGGGGLIVNVTNSGGVKTMDKTYAEIYEALKAGTPCFMLWAGNTYSSDIDTDYTHGVSLAEITICYKYNTDYRIVAVSGYYSTVGDTNYAFVPANVIFQASTSTDYPTFLRTIIVNTASCSAINQFIVW